MSNSIICKICNKEFFSFNMFHEHIKNYNITIEEYYLKYISTDPLDGKCHREGCSNKTNFRNINKGFRKYCCTKCAMNSSNVKNKRKNTLIDKYGVENISQSENIKNKKKQTCLDNYGVDNPAKSKEIYDKVKQTNLERYGCENPAQNKEVYDKVKQTNLSKYGCESPMQSDEVKERSKTTCLEKYGVEYVFQNDEVREKAKQTIIDKYEVENISQSKEIREKAKKTMIDRFGTEHALQNKELLEKSRSSRFKSFFEYLFNSNRLNGIVSPNFTFDDYKGIENKYSWVCTKCNTIFEDHLRDGRIPRCPSCYPPSIGTSIGEQEVFSFVQQYFSDAESRNRSIISPMELDIYIPSRNFAIEFDGLFWHSEINGEKDSNYHLNKTLECTKNNIRLIHIFEDEWIDKQEIIKSIILSKLNMTNYRIFARLCEIKSVDPNNTKMFLDNNHLQGSINGNNLGLYFNNELQCILTYGKPRFDLSYDIEILRFCNKLNTVVIGGLSKLINCLKENSIISYVDKRYGNGKSYETCGFKLIRECKPSYYYVKDYKRYNRLQFQKHLLNEKLNNFNQELTEWQNMQLNGYDRIWDCGNLVYSNKT